MIGKVTNDCVIFQLLEKFAAKHLQLNWKLVKCLAKSYACWLI